MRKALARSVLLFLLAVVVGGITQTAMAQSSKAEYRQSQSRMLEPMQQVFVRPLVVDLKVTESKRQTSTWPFPEYDVTKMTLADINNLKVNALYLTAQKFDADVIIAPTFDVRTVKKGIEITVNGYPASYENWKVATSEEDYGWIEDVYGIKIRVQDHTQALGGNTPQSHLEVTK